MLYEKVLQCTAGGKSLCLAGRQRSRFGGSHFGWFGKNVAWDVTQSAHMGLNVSDNKEKCSNPLQGM